MTYRFGPVFCARPTGVPFEVLDALGTPDVSALARQLIALEDEARRAGTGVVDARRELARPARRRARGAIERLEPLPAELGAGAYGALLDELARTRAALDERLRAAGDRARHHLWAGAAAWLPGFLVIESESSYEELLRHPDRAEGLRRRKDRQAELSLARYLQRVCAKNDTFSSFGPATWGRLEPAARGLAIDLAPGIARRAVSVERWVVRAFVAAINADPRVRAELCPRRHPNGRLDGTAFVRLDTGTEHQLDEAERALLARCDGLTPAHELDPARLEALARAGAILWQVELVAWDQDPLATLIADVERWRDAAPRQAWLPRLFELAELARRFEVELAPEARRAIIAQVRARSAALGGAAPKGSTLYQASNPLVEHCYRAPGVVLGASAMAQVLEDVAPWLDLFGDTYSLAASRCYERLRELHATAPRRAGGLSLAAFLTHCDARGFHLRESGLAAVARQAFDEAKAAFRGALASRSDAAEWQLTCDDCHVLRRTHAFPPAADLGWPAPDLQVAARSLEDIAEGRCTWILAEVHALFTPLQRVFERWCPDPAALAEIYRGGRPWLIPSRAGFFGSVHVAPEPMVTTMPHATFCAPERPRPGWRCVPPSETEVVVLDDQHDVRVRARATGEDLGSLVRTTWMSLGGIHPFFPLELTPHTPRLRLGATIVQRRTWRVTWSELGIGRPQGDPTPALIAAIERLRARRDLPRWVYVRPSSTLLERTALSARDRDVKPMYIDLESTLFLEIFVRYLHKHAELDVSEMRPSPEELCWREPGGRYGFELRMMCPPVR